MNNGDILEETKFRYFIVLSLILHLFFLVIFRVNLKQKSEELNPTYVRIVELPSLASFPEKMAEINQRPGAVSKETLGRREEAGRSVIEEAKKSDKQIPRDAVNPLSRDPSAKGIRGLPLITGKDIERFAKAEEPSLKKKEKNITLDTDEFKYYSYLERLKNRVEFVWKYPDVARINNLHGDLYMSFTILKNGRLGNTHLLRSSGYKALDEAALQALKDSDPFWPLPESWNLEEFTITGHFIYYLGGIYLR